MSSILMRMPLEILHTIFACLDLESIKCLRLTDHSLSTICLTPYFLSSIAQPSTDLSDESLFRLEALVRNNILRHKCHTLTISACYHDSNAAETRVATGRFRKAAALRAKASTECLERELTEATEDLAWLKARRHDQEAQTKSDTIQRLTPILSGFECVHTVRLSAVIVRGHKVQVLPSDRNPWTPVWARASWVYDVVMSAVRQSGISLRNLDIYRSLQWCSLTCRSYSSPLTSWTVDDLLAVGKDLEVLSVSLSTGIDNRGFSRLGSRERAIMEDNTGFAHRELVMTNDVHSDITRLLQNAPKLLQLDLHLYHLSDFNLMPYASIFHTLASQVRIPSLRKCKLSGLMVSEESLLLFLKKHPQLQSLALQEIYLTEGTWPPVFSYLSTSMPDLEDLKLSNLLWHDREGDSEEEDGNGRVKMGTKKKHVNLEPVWDIGIPQDESIRVRYNSGLYFVHTRHFDQEDLRKGLHFTHRSTRQVISPSVRRWGMKRWEEYGPLLDY
ncbi:hypothetical protein BJX99DRAFT_231297 [Aspergillus californicus]